MITRTQHLLLTPCRSDDQLHDWVRVFLGLNVPRRAVCAGHDAPFEYLRRAYFEPADDMIVWAPRGGGKTRLAAVATLLDLLHKPGVSVRILGGSLEQSLRMWEHLVPDLERLVPDLLQSRRIQSRRLRLRNGSTCAVLTQSQRAVRGLRVQKLRCDEVELFDRGVWEAAQLVTRSREGRDCRLPISNCQMEERTSRCTGGVSIGNRQSAIGNEIAGCIEALSTHHRPFGLMHELLEAQQSQATPRLIRWCVLDVLQRCEPARDCGTCPLWDDCRGAAKTACEGFVSIDDAIALKRRVSADCWAAEMMCRRPSVRGCVFPMFDPAVHVRESRVLGGGSEVAAVRSTDDPQPTTHLSLDFGFANPFVCLWIRCAGRGDEALVHVIDEYVQAQQTLEAHLQQIQLKGYGTVQWVSCDPAGAGRSDQTAASNVTLLRRAGYRVRHRASRVVDGIEQIRAALRPAAGEPRLFIDPRCVRLIEALRGYRYDDGNGAVSELPLKDGRHDHLVDALRYFFVNNIDRRVIVKSY